MKNTQQGAGINPANLQEMLDSAPNALALGQRQWLTPADYAAAFSLPFTGLKAEAVCDLQMGRGDLLITAPPQHKLGLDIDADCGVRPKGAKGNWTAFTGDTTLFADLLDEAGFACDLFTLNPPFSLLWEKKRFEFLKKSRLPAVEDAFTTAKGRHLDSTLATLMLALHFCSLRGEGYLVCNEATAERLLGAPGAEAASPIRRHVWLWLSIPGSIFAGTITDLRVAVLYFAADHSREGPPHHVTAAAVSPGEVERVLTGIADTRWKHRGGLSVEYPGSACRTTVERWGDASDEWKARTAEKPEWNLWLEGGLIRTHLTPFQKLSGRIPKKTVLALDSLRGQFPSSLVVQKASRTALLAAVHGGLWRVDPQLPAIVAQAIADYNSVRAPFYPLSEVQRIGYLDESDTIECRKHGLAGFTAGTRYPLESRTVAVSRKGSKMNLSGEMDAIEVSGSDLLLSITDGEQEHHFVPNPAMIPGREEDPALHSLQELLEYFVIPEVPDIASLQPARFEAALGILERMEIEANRKTGGKFAFKNYQRNDYARASLHSGCILAHQAGMGKTMAAFAYPILKGSRVTLIIAPDSLHAQIIEEGRSKFGIELKTIESQKGLLADRELWGRGGGSDGEMEKGSNGEMEKWRKGADAESPHSITPSLHHSITPSLPPPLHHSITPSLPPPLHHSTTPSLPPPLHHSTTPPLPPLWRIISYTVLGMNGGDEWEPRMDENDNILFNADREKRRQSIPGWEPEHALGIGTVKNGIRCVLYPTVSTLIAGLFDCVVVDEGVRMKSTDAYVAQGVRNLCPASRLVMTATPVKNRLEDIFWLAHWVCGGTEEPNARFPYENSNEARERFANEHQLQERNLTKEAASRRANRPKRYVKRTAQICNIHRLWKLLGPVVVRRLKNECGTDIAPKVVIPVRVKPGSAQNLVYKHHLLHPPAVVKGGARAINENAALAVQLNLLRQAALCPDAPGLSQYGGGPASRSWTDFNPKSAAACSIIVERLGMGQQVILMSPYQHASATLHERLLSAGVAACLLDGKTSPHKRAELAREFKRQRYSVMVAGQKAMGEGHSFECCPNLIRLSLDWAFDINDQSADRVHRINSAKEVRIWDLLTEGTVDERLFSLYHEKGDSANLALDARLVTEQTEEVNLAQLLHDAIAGFNPDAETIDEQTIETEWPALKAKLAHAERTFREFHPPITEVALDFGPRGGTRRQLALDDLNAALRGLHEPAATVRNNPKPQPRFTPTADDALQALLDSLDQGATVASVRDRVSRKLKGLE